VTGTVFDFESVMVKDDLGMRIAEIWNRYNMQRVTTLSKWDELKRYLYATDTSTTTNRTLPWKNSTTLPKLTQIRDNLYANYMKALFPKRKWLDWIAFDEESDKPEKRKAIQDFMYYVIDRSDFKNIVSRLVLDYIDYGNAIAAPAWKDETQFLEDRTAVGYTGPIAKRLSPLDTVFNPLAASFTESPKIVKALISLGEVKKLIEQESTEENKKYLDDLWKYMLEIRHRAANWVDYGQTYKDTSLRVDGFGSYQMYLSSNYVEVLTFFGDIYDELNDKFYKNHIIRVVDRHRVLSLEPNPSQFGFPQIFHAGWRDRQDNLWSMGPLDNLVGMQYRIDHLENLNADLMDLTAYPVQKIKGFVEDYEWGPMEKIFIGDDGDVELLTPDSNSLMIDNKVGWYEAKMEEMAGAPKEALGIRTPGEKTAYEVQRLENAASRVFQTKVQIFEEQIIEPLLNAMLEMAKRKMTGSTLVRIFDDELKVATFEEISPEDITGNGRIVPMAARHFAEYAEKVQNVTAFFSSQVGMDPLVKAHFSSVALAEMFEDLLDLSGYKLVVPNIRISEEAEAQRLQMTQGETTQMHAMTPSGLTPDDYSGPPSDQGGVQ